VSATTVSTGPAARTRLSARQRGALVLEVLIAYGHVRRCMTTLTLPETVSRLRSAPRSRRALPLPDPRAQGRHLGHVVTRTLAVVPARTACLTRSLVMLRMLAARGINAELVIAAAPSESKPLDAHAWVELDGRPLLAPEPAFGRLLTL
jgi:hypothetical protein